MAKMNQMQKCMAANEVLRICNGTNIEGGETITIVIETKRNGDIKEVSIKKGEEE